MPRFSEEKVLWSRLTARTSSKRVIDQKPPYPGTLFCGLKCTGDSRYIRVNSS
jgi:hypothetical protein